MRARGAYADAAGAAREALALVRADSTAKPFEVDDAERRAATLERILRLPPDQRDSLATADHLFPVLDSLYARSDYEEGAAAARRQAEIFGRILGPQEDDVGGSLEHLARFLRAKGDLAGAEPIYREALRVSRKVHGSEHPDVASCMNNLAILLNNEGDFASAEPLFRESLAMLRRLLGPAHSWVAGSLNNLAAQLQDQGDFGAAEPLFRESLELRRKVLGNEHAEVATCMTNLARLLDAKGDYAAAEPLLRDALAMRRKLLGNDDPAVAISLRDLARLLDDEGEPNAAEPLYQEALEIQTRRLGEHHPMVATTQHNLGNLLEEEGKFVEAEEVFRKALATREAVLGEQHVNVVTSQQELGHLLYARGRVAESESLLSLAARNFEAARLRSGSGIERATFLKSPYPSLALARLDLGKMGAAWEAMEQSHARALADLLIASRRRVLTASESAREDSLKRRLGDLEQELQAQQSAERQEDSPGSKAAFDEARDRLLTAEADWSQFRAEMEDRCPIAQGRPLPLERVQAALDPQTALVGWLDVEVPTGRFTSWGYVIRDRGPVAWVRLPADDEDSPFRRGHAFRSVLASPASMGVVVDRASARLYTERIEPLIGALAGVENLIVIPSGAMLGIPVEALTDGKGVPLVDRYSISYAPSATIHAWLSERARALPDADRRRDGSRRNDAVPASTHGGPAAGGPLGEALFVGDPPFAKDLLASVEPDSAAAIGVTASIPATETIRGGVRGDEAALARLPRLPGTRDEVLSLSALWPGSTVLLGRDASEAALERLRESGELARFRVLHFATHALVDDERPENSALVLSRADLPDPLRAGLEGVRPEDGLVSAKEVLREWRLNAELVTLSACESALGKEVPGEGYVGLAHAFLQAGARSLLLSLWGVPDHATSLLMRRFYENWTGRYADDREGRRGVAMTKADALAEAKRWLRRYAGDDGHHPYEHPYYWSAFILIGERG